MQSSFIISFCGIGSAVAGNAENPTIGRNSNRWCLPSSPVSAHRPPHRDSAVHSRILKQSLAKWFQVTLEVSTREDESQVQYMNHDEFMVNGYESLQACSASQRVRFYANPSTQPGSPGSMIQRPTARSYQRRAWSGGSGSGPQTNWHPIQLVIWNLQSKMWLQATWVCSFCIYIYMWHMHIYICIYYIQTADIYIYLFMNGILEWGLKTFFLSNHRLLNLIQTEPCA